MKGVAVTSEGDRVRSQLASRTGSRPTSRAGRAGPGVCPAPSFPRAGFTCIPSLSCDQRALGLSASRGWRLHAGRRSEGRGVHTVFRPGLKNQSWDPVLFLLPVCQPDERTQQRVWRPSGGRVTRRKDPGPTGVWVEQSAHPGPQWTPRGPAAPGELVSPAVSPSSPSSASCFIFTCETLFL